MTTVDEAQVLRTIGGLYLQVEQLRRDNAALVVQLRRAEAAAAANEASKEEEPNVSTD